MPLDKKSVIAPLFLVLTACANKAPLTEEAQQKYSPTSQPSSSLFLFIKKQEDKERAAKERNYIQENGMVRGVDCENFDRNTVDIERTMPCEYRI